MADEFFEGFDALGRPVPYKRRQSAYEAVKQMVPGVAAGDAMELVDRASDHIARDEPYEAMSAISGNAPFARNPDTTGPAGEPCKIALDVTGTYRLMAHLLA